MTKLNATISGGIGGTAIMSTVSALIGMAGGPKMNSALLLSYMLNVPQIAGWIFHFVVGILFALIYTFLVMPRLSRISSTFGKGIIFGLIAFLIAMISLPAMGAIFGRMPPMVGSVPSMMAVSITEHVVFGIAVVLIFDKLST
jgi:uncharacterized membrane protein YagU involved in acid resistance